MLKHILKSTLLGCLALNSACLSSTSLLARSTTMLPSPIIDSSFNSTDSQAIAQAVLKDAIATEKLDKTAKVTQIEQVRRDVWKYNPVPYWKIAIADRRQTLTYFTTQDGKFRVLMFRNGQPTHPIQEVATEIRNTALSQAVTIWGYPANPQPQITAEKAGWARGCEDISAPFACDPVPVQGWKITLSLQQSRWVFRGETVEDLQLIERTSSLDDRLPIQVQNEIRRIAGNHFQLSSAVVLVANVESQTFTDSCLGLGDLTETCARQAIAGYRVTVAGKANQEQIYRISNDAKILRTEAIAGLPTRTDELPTSIALKVFDRATLDLKQPVATLKIARVEPIFNCFRYPTDPPNHPCTPLTSVKGWKVTVTSFQKAIAYSIESNGTILGKR